MRLRTSFLIHLAQHRVHGEKVRREQRANNAQKVCLLAAFMQYHRLSVKKTLVLRALLPWTVDHAASVTAYRNLFVCANIVQVRVA